MAVTVGNALLFLGSAVAAVCALFWPQIEQAFAGRQMAYTSRPGAAGGSTASGKCPLVSLKKRMNQHLILGSETQKNFQKDCLL